MRLAPLLGAVLLLVQASQATAAGSAPTTRSPPPPSLGEHGAVLEGTWELERLRLPDGRELRSPIARGVIVIDKGAYLAASYLQPSAERTVGNVWEGRLVIDGSRFRLEAATGYRYDSTADPRAVRDIPPPVKGSVESTAHGLVFTKDGGGTVTFSAAKGLRIQVEADGTVIEHRRTSLVPRIPKDLPGR